MYYIINYNDYANIELRQRVPTHFRVFIQTTESLKLYININN